MVKNVPANAGDTGLIPGSERSPGAGNGNTLQYSCPGNPTDRGAQWARVQGVTRVGHDLATKQQGNKECWKVVAVSHASSGTTILIR